MTFRTCVLLLAAACIAAADPVALAADGIHIQAGKAGALVLAWPTLTGKDSAKTGEQAKVKLSGAVRAALTYADGTVVDVRRTKTGLELTFNHMPSEATVIRAGMKLPVALRGELTLQIGNEKGGFPADKPPKPFLFQGNATTFYLVKGEDPQLSLTTPEWAYQQLQDNREWNNNNSLEWWFAAPLNKDHLTIPISISVGK